MERDSVYKDSLSRRLSLENSFLAFSEEPGPLEFEIIENKVQRDRALTDAELRTFEKSSTMLATPFVQKLENNELVFAKLRLSSILLKSAKAGHESLNSSYSMTMRERALLIDWVVGVMSSFDQSQLSVFRTIWILDSFLATKREKMGLDQIKVIGISAILMASKFESSNQINRKDFEYSVIRNQFTNEQLLLQEIEIFEALGFSLNRNTPVEVIHAIIDILSIESDKNFDFLSKNANLISLMSLYSLELTKMFTLEDIAGVSLIIATKMSKKGENFHENEFCSHIIEKLKIDSKLIDQKISIVFQFVQNFENIFPFAKNFKAWANFRLS